MQKILSINLVKQKAGDKERMLAEYYESLLDLSREQMASRGQEVGYRSFDWHKQTKNGVEPFEHLLKELEPDYLEKIGVYHEVRNKFTKEGRVEQW